MTDELVAAHVLAFDTVQVLSAAIPWTLFFIYSRIVLLEWGSLAATVDQPFARDVLEVRVIARGVSLCTDRAGVVRLRLRCDR